VAYPDPPRISGIVNPDPICPVIQNIRVNKVQIILTLNFPGSLCYLGAGKSKEFTLQVQAE
jgi:hypothetical protein